MLTEDIRFETIGTSQASGVFEGKAALVDLEGLVAEVIDGGIGITIDAVFVDESTVVVQARGESVTRVARIPYNNSYLSCAEDARQPDRRVDRVSRHSARRARDRRGTRCPGQDGKVEWLK
jgi:hypothetical protein